MNLLTHQPKPPVLPPAPRAIIVPKRKEGTLIDFLMMTEKEVMDKFLTLPNAIKVGEGDASFVYVPPTRERSVLLVAHADTIPGDGVKVGLCEGYLYSLDDKKGIGADDRAGCAMLWKLRGLGHGLLIPNGEESGLVGSRFLMSHEEWRKKINSHLFAIQMDRMGDDDLAFYDVASNKFKDWCEEQLQADGHKYTRTHGSSTDICALCDADSHKEDCIDGVNISVGYYAQHTPSETVCIAEWQRTLSLLHKCLSQQDIPSFKHKYIPYTPNSHYGGSGMHQRQMGFNAEAGYTPRGTVLSNNSTDALDSLLVCPSLGCDAIIDESEYLANNKKCTYCQQEF